jgi:hypothetical protein
VRNGKVAKPMDAPGAWFVGIKRLYGGHVADFRFSPRSIWLVLSAQEYVCKATWFTLSSPTALSASASADGRTSVMAVTCTLRWPAAVY